MRRELIVVSRVASSKRGDGFADLSPENQLRAQATNSPGKDFPSARWLTERSKILARVTVPAMERVTVPFTWVWRVCDERREQAEKLRDKLFPQAVVLDDRCLTAPEVAPDADRFLTVRLDSDDALLPAALDEIAGRNIPPGSIVNWAAGWEWNLNTGEVAAKEWPRRVQGPFLGLTHEGRDEMLQAGVPHTYAREGRRVVTVGGRNWVQTLHGRNQLSRWQGREVCSAERARRVLAPFGIEP